MSVYNVLSSPSSQGSGPSAPGPGGLDPVSGLPSGPISQVTQPGGNSAPLPSTERLVQVRQHNLKRRPGELSSA